MPTDHRDTRPDAVPSARWNEPAYVPEGRYWRATLREPLSSRERAEGGAEVAFGPTRAACVAETVRIDRYRVARRAAHATASSVLDVLAELGTRNDAGEVVFVAVGGWLSGPCLDVARDDDPPA